MTQTITFTFDEARHLACRALQANGFSLQHAEAIAQNVTAAEADGYTSHGLYRVLVCIRTLKAGKISADAQPIISDSAPAVLRVDARGGVSLVALQQALPRFIEKVRHNGIAALAINHCVHYSALWADIEPLTEQGLVALACTPNHAWVAPAGGSKPLFGTNPIAFGWPRPGGVPFVFDMATSQIARGDIELHRRNQKPVPEGWGIDRHGQPTTDATDVLNGAMLTFGGHKGSALAAMVELLAGPLIGDLTSEQSLAWDDGAGASPYGGELIIAMDPQRFLGAEADKYLAVAEVLFSNMANQGARVPGERRHRNRAASRRHGVTLPATLVEEIEQLTN